MLKITYFAEVFIDNELVDLLLEKIAIFPNFLKILSFSGLLPQNQGLSDAFFIFPFPAINSLAGLEYLLRPTRNTVLLLLIGKKSESARKKI